MPKKKLKTKIEINQQFKAALEIMEDTDSHAFITGKAGTGKSTLLEYFRSQTEKNVAILAPTGVAALNVKGQTIHSFFQFPPQITKEEIKKQRLSTKRRKLYKELETIVIDEVSMVRADLLDYIDQALRKFRNKKKEPFGGVQMIFIGDLYQLPPVVAGQEERDLFTNHYKSPYFFSAEIFADLPIEMVELEKIYRQKDQKFINLLNKIRNNSVEEKDMKILNARYQSDFKLTADSQYITLTPTNKASDVINRHKLNKLKTKQKYYQGAVDGKFGDSHLPTMLDLKLKQGAQVMMLNNDPDGNWVNGSIGTIVGIEPGDKEEHDILKVKLTSGKIVTVERHTWNVYEYFFDVKKGALDVRTLGSFIQYPLRLAWSVTIHKSQGKTFDKVIIDIGRGTFAHGQTYVALSRCRSLEGIVLKKPILKNHIWMDWKIVRFLTQFQYDRSEEGMSLADKVSFIDKVIGKKATLKMTYLRANDIKSQRVIEPYKVGEMEYQGKSYMGMKAHCQKRGEDRTFRVDRILEMEKG
ncbi:MAG: AAA family ATPase [Parcubacteria group bacterium]|nr:AAA family ATPase [Parcubacteria group bacterium]